MLQAIDGKTSLQEIAQAAAKKFPPDLPSLGGRASTAPPS